jgi:hypothetical protein
MFLYPVLPGMRSERVKTTVIPIPKNAKKSLNKSENYRGISLSSICGKILDYIILEKYGEALRSGD